MNEKISKVQNNFSLSDLISNGAKKLKTTINETKEKAIKEEMDKGFDRTTAEKNIIDNLEKERKIRERKAEMRRKHEELLAEQERLNNRNIFEKAWDGTKEFADNFGGAVSDQIDRFQKNYEHYDNTGAQDIIRDNFITNTALALTKDFNDTKAKYEEDVRNNPENRNRALDILGSLGSAPTTFVTGAEMTG